MLYARIFVVALALFSGHAVLAGNAQDVMTDSARLSVMLDEDQADRISWQQKKMDTDTILKRDEERRAEVKRMLAAAQVRTANDFYCASVEWEWGDGTKSENKIDCDPYESGKSEIKRRYVQEHTFRTYPVDPVATSPEGPAQYRVKFSLKQKNKVVGSGQTMVEVRSGGGFGQ